MCVRLSVWPFIWADQASLQRASCVANNAYLVKAVVVVFVASSSFTCVVMGQRKGESTSC